MLRTHSDGGTIVPVALFAYARPDHLAQTIEGLRRNDVPLLYVFCDGPRSESSRSAVAEVRRIVRAVDWCDCHVVEREKNWGLAGSVRAGVSSVLKEHDRVIVVEDDVVLRPGAYAYTVAGLEHYADSGNVMTVSMWSHPALVPEGADSGYFSRRFFCWGWATYRWAWEKYVGEPLEIYRTCLAKGIPVLDWGRDLEWQALNSAERNLWAAGYTFTHFLYGSVSYIPPVALTINTGADGSGGNISSYSGQELLPSDPLAPVAPPRTWPEVSILPGTEAAFAKFYAPRRKNLRALRRGLALALRALHGRCRDSSSPTAERRPRMTSPREGGGLMDRPIFICGNKKSGTSLLLALLDGHPQLAVYPEETVFFRDYLPRVADWHDEQRLALAKRSLVKVLPYSCASVSDAAGPESEDVPYLAYGMMCREYDKILAGRTVLHDGDLLAACVAAYARVYGTDGDDMRGWVEKTPWNEYYADLIFKWWPMARCLHIVRDPRDNFLAIERKHPGTPVMDFCRNWSRSLATGEKNQRRYGKDAYMILTYEELAMRPDTTLAKVREFLGVMDSEALRVPTLGGVPWGGNSMFDGEFDGISTKPVGRWKKVLADEDRRAIEAFCRAGMSRMGYPGGRRPNMGDCWRLTAWLCAKVRERFWGRSRRYRERCERV